MMRHLLIAATVAVLISAIPLQQAAAHGGGLDRHGCHHETATGGYHCHRGSRSDDPDWGTAAAILGGLVVVVLVLHWTKPGARAAYLTDDPSASTSLQIKLHRGEIEDIDHLDYLGLLYKVRF